MSALAHNLRASSNEVSGDASHDSVHEVQWPMPSEDDVAWSDSDDDDQKDAHDDAHDDDGSEEEGLDALHIQKMRAVYLKCPTQGCKFTYDSALYQKCFSCHRKSLIECQGFKCTKMILKGKFNKIGEKI